ncbi:hypothetical protein [Acetobacter pasteurianus]|uniref:Uncharacterized protein n=1 Tax=Acetobacter pasteurianus subsp. pasteurianus TaxID=481145 RepID=A0A1Y0Y0J5_ACEPA|nr:hypothetical protein [Acetobacter pasteurianus]ARW48710.1 hypothetical protein S1001342_02411 [Acetobacter pasteurianus subsp. pasteurianus]
MNFLLSLGAIIFLSYLACGWIGVTESSRLTVAIVGGGILWALGTMGNIINKKSSQGEKSPTGQFRLGRYTAGVQEADLSPTMGGRCDIFCRLTIGYLDAKNDFTIRNIDVLNYTVAATPDGEIVPYYLMAFCEMRQAKRTFRADRILECSTENRKVDDLLGVLQKAPESTVFDRKITILQPVTVPAIIIEYQFRAPKFQRITVRSDVVGYTEQKVKTNYIKNMVFIEGRVDEKDDDKLLKADRIQNAWRADNNEPIQDLQSFLLGPQRKPMSVPNA